MLKSDITPVYLLEPCRPVLTLVDHQALRSSSGDELFVPHVNTSTIQRRAFSVVAPSIWNALLLEILSESNTPLFYKLLKTDLITMVGLGATLSGFLGGALYKFTKWMNGWMNEWTTSCLQQIYAFLRFLCGANGKNGCESQPLGPMEKKEEIGINLFEMKCLWQILRVSGTERRTRIGDLIMSLLAMRVLCFFSQSRVHVDDM